MHFLFGESAFRLCVSDKRRCSRHYLYDQAQMQRDCRCHQASWFPDLPGCVTERKNLEQAIEMGIDAASGWILGELEDEEQIP